MLSDLWELLCTVRLHSTPLESLRPQEAPAEQDRDSLYGWDCVEKAKSNLLQWQIVGRGYFRGYIHRSTLQDAPGAGGTKCASEEASAGGFLPNQPHRERCKIECNTGTVERQAGGEIVRL